MSKFEIGDLVRFNEGALIYYQAKHREIESKRIFVIIEIEDDPEHLKRFSKTGTKFRIFKTIDLTIGGRWNWFEHTIEKL